MLARYDPHDSAGNWLLRACLSGDIASRRTTGGRGAGSRRSRVARKASIARVSVIRWDPRSAQTVYAGSVYQGTAPRVPFLFRSKDGGATWQSVLDPARLKP